MKKCDLCGDTGNHMTEIFEHLRSREVKDVCHTCADIIGKYCDDVKAYADAREKALVRQLKAQVDRQRKAEIGNKGHWLAIHLRAWFQKEGMGKAFELGRRHG